MAKKIKNKYTVAKLPISDEVRQGLHTGVFIDVLSALGTMMTQQDDSYEDSFKELKDSLKEITTIIKVGFTSIDSRLTSIELKISGLEAKDNDFEKRMKEIETRLDDYYLRLKNHKHIEYEKTA